MAQSQANIPLPAITKSTETGWSLRFQKGLVGEKNRTPLPEGQ